jgi:hypothetical protein
VNQNIAVEFKFDDFSEILRDLLITVRQSDFMTAIAWKLVERTLMEDVDSAGM